MKMTILPSLSFLKETGNAGDFLHLQTVRGIRPSRGIPAHPSADFPE